MSAEPAPLVPARSLTRKRQHDPSQHDSLREYVQEKESHELVFALAGYIGSGCSTLASPLLEALQTLSYDPAIISVSKLIEARAPAEGSEGLIPRTQRLQAEGDKLRLEHGGSIVAGLIIREIKNLRMTAAAEDDELLERAFIVDALKNPQEEEMLRKVYGDSFYLIGVLANEDTRKQRLADSKFKYADEFKAKSVKDTAEHQTKIEKIMSDDASADALHGQRVKDLLERSDFFIANESNLDTKLLAKTFADFVAAATESRVVRPTRDERGMQAAWSSSLKSSCMSRQVGAAILSKNGEVLAVGTNDPPKAGGGIYSHSPEGESDHRCFNDPPGKGYCRNDHQKREIYEQAFSIMQTEGIQIGSVDDLAKILKKTQVGALIEFSRAIHAEMDALLALVRTGTPLPPGSTLYTTVFPCHSCARHIVAAGVSEVVYIEPFGKSMAIKLHGDAIESISVAKSSDVPSKTEHPKVIFRLFTGVAPRRHAKLFEKKRDIKDKEHGNYLTHHDSKHISPTLTRGFLDLEDDIAERVAGMLQEPSHE